MESFRKPQTPRKRRIAKRRIRSFKWFWRALRSVAAPYLRKKFRVHAENSELVQRMRPPYLILPNHSSVIDPFFVGSHVPDVIHYVVSDANFRSPLVNFGLALVGSIPKTKAMTDMDSIKNIMKVTRQGEVVGIFPEGQSTWDGHSLPLFYSTAKLIKVLRVPVIVARISGAFLSKPRWARYARRGRVNVRFDVAFTSEQLKNATVPEVDAKINKMLEHDDYEYNRVVGQKFYGKRRAEYAEIALFICPSCKSISTLRSHRNLLSCGECRYAVRFGLNGFLQQKKGALKFDNLHDWNVWQREEFARRVEDFLLGAGETPLIVEHEVEISTGYKSQPLQTLMKARLELHQQTIEALGEHGQRLRLPIAEIRGINVQNKERLELYIGDDLYRIVPTNPRGCTYKWDLAVRLAHALQEREQSDLQEA
ncbi:MAG: lysophospholipid acyltransferase family protein [Spirochaetota bacterium]